MCLVEKCINPGLLPAFGAQHRLIDEWREACHLPFGKLLRSPALEVVRLQGTKQRMIRKGSLNQHFAFYKSPGGRGEPTKRAKC